MEQLDKTGSAGFLFGFAGLFATLIMSFPPVLAYVLAFLVMVVGMVLLNQD